MALRRMEVNPLLSFAGLYGTYKLWNGCLGLRKKQDTGIGLVPRPPPAGVEYDAGFQLYSRHSLRDRFPASPCRPWWMHLSIATQNQIEAPIEAVEGEGLASSIVIDANEVTAVAEILSETEVPVPEIVATNDGNEVQIEMASSMDDVDGLRTEGEIEAEAPEELFTIQSHIETAYSGEITGAEGEIEAAAPEGFFPIQSHIETTYSGEMIGAENHIEDLVDDVAVPEEVVPIMNHIEALVDDVVVPKELVPIVNHIEALVQSKNQIVLVDDAVNAEGVLAFESHTKVHIDAGVAEVGEDSGIGSQNEKLIDIGATEVAANDKIERLTELLVSDAIDVAILEEVTVTERESQMNMQLSDVKCVIPVSKTLNRNKSKGEHKQKPNKVSHGWKSSGEVCGREFVEDYSEVGTRDHSSYLLPENIFSWDSGKDIVERHKINELCETPKTLNSADLVLGNGKSKILEPEPTVPMKNQKVQEIIHERVSTMTSTCVSSARANTKALGQTQNIAFGSGQNTTKKIPTKDVLDNKKIEALKLEQAASPEKVHGVIKKRVSGMINTASATKSNPKSLGQTQKNAFGRIKNATSMQIATKGPVIKRLCSGSMGRVYVAHTNQGKLAIKTLKSEKMSTLNESQIAMHIKLLYEEAWLLSNLKHPKILSFKLMIPNFQDGLPGMATEFISEGSLYDCLHRRGDQRLRTWGSILSIAQQVVDAMMFLHDVGVVHFDLKSPNILMEYTSLASTVPVCK